MAIKTKVRNRMKYVYTIPSVAPSNGFHFRRHSQRRRERSSYIISPSSALPPPNIARQSVGSRQ